MWNGFKHISFLDLKLENEWEFPLIGEEAIYD